MVMRPAIDMEIGALESAIKLIESHELEALYIPVEELQKRVQQLYSCLLIVQWLWPSFMDKQASAIADCNKKIQIRSLDVLLQI